MSITAGGYYDSGPDEVPEPEQPTDDRRSDGVTYTEFARRVRAKFTVPPKDEDIERQYRFDKSVAMASMVLSGKVGGGG